MMIIREKLEKTAKKKIEIPRGGVTRPPNHTREEINRPPSQIKNNSYSVIRTALISADETRFLTHISFTLCPLFNSSFISMGQKKKEPPRSVSWVYKDRFKWQRGVNCVLKFHNKLVEYFPT